MFTGSLSVAWAIAVSFAVLAVTAPTPAASTQRITLRTDDGVVLAAMWYEPSTRPAPAVILVHMLQRSRRDFEALASRLSADGIGALAIDLRGHGESQHTGEIQDYSSFVLDVKAARRFLAGRSDVQQSRVGIVGASLGANLAMLEAGGDGSIASVALLSPSLEYRGLRIEPSLRKYGARPALLVAADDDPYAARSARELRKVGEGRRELLILSHAGHGTQMLGRDPDLVRTVTDWFKRTL